MTKSLCSALIAVVLTNLLLGQECVTIQKNEEQSLLRVVAHCPGNDTQQALSARAARILAASTSAKQKFKDIIVSADRQELQRSVIERLPRIDHSGAGMDQIRRTLLNDNGWDPHKFAPILRLLQIGPDVISTYSSSGSIDVRGQRPVVTDTLIRGRQDPRSLVSGGAKLKFLWLNEASGGGFPDRFLFAAFKASQPINCGACLAALEWIYPKALPKVHTRIRVRTDVWFDETEYPMLFRFEPDDPQASRYWIPNLFPPGVAFYYGQQEIACSRDGEFRPSCTLSGSWSDSRAKQAIERETRKR